MKHIPESPTPLLVVDDDKGHLLSVKALLKKSDIPEPALLSDSRQVLSMIRHHGFVVVLLDLMMPHVDGMALLKEIKTGFPEVECIVVTAVDDTASAVRAMKYGAYDYMVKPVSRDRLTILIHRALERHTLRKGMSLNDRAQTLSDLKNPKAFSHMAARDPAMIRVMRQAEVVAPTDYSVIITGESGTGKEMMARAIHRAGRRSAHPFVAVNMGAFSSSLFESEFFGRARGAFTGASENRPGFLEAARGGTLFLDEITDLALSRQGVLLRVLQEKEFYRIGSTRPRRVDVRILAATNKDIHKEVAAGRFRPDLFHRLNMYQVAIPRLAERKGDIPLLASHFLNQFAKAHDKSLNGLSPGLARCLGAYDFPGNVRELKNIIARAVLLEQGRELSTASLPPESPLLAGALPALPGQEPGEEALPPLHEIEKRYIQKVLAAADGNRTRAAAILGIGLRTLQRKLKSYNTPSS